LVIGYLPFGFKRKNMKNIKVGNDYALAESGRQEKTLIFTGKTLGGFFLGKYGFLP
jgi:hypothetical protein